MNVMRRRTFVELVLLIASFVLIVPSNQLEQQSPEAHSSNYTINSNETDVGAAQARGSWYNVPVHDLRKNSISTLGKMSVSHFRSSIPMRIFECLRDFSTLRCTKLFVLQKMEGRKNWINTGNVTKDFFNQFFGDEEQMGSLTSERFRKMSDNDLNKKLVANFQRFFKNRDIKLQFLPGLMVKVIPSKENKLKFALKKKTKYYEEGRAHEGNALTAVLKDNGLVDASLEGNTSLDEDDLDGKSKNKISKKKPKRDKTSYKQTILQMAVPVMMMPAILMGTFLPFILPVLKMATITTMIMNNTAFMAALIYAARTHVNAQEEQHINYSYGSHQGYH